MPKEIKPKRAARTVKEKKFVKEYVGNGGNAAQAVRDAGYNVFNPNAARVIGSQNLAKLNVQEILERNGITDDATAQNLARMAFTAQKQNQFTGEITEDNQVQLDAIKHITKLKGWLKDSEQPGIHIGQFINNQKGEYGFDA